MARGRRREPPGAEEQRQLCAALLRVPEYFFGVGFKPSACHQRGNKLSRALRIYRIRRERIQATRRDGSCRQHWYVKDGRSKAPVTETGTATATPPPARRMGRPRPGGTTLRRFSTESCACGMLARQGDC